MLEPAPLIETADAKAPPGGEASWFAGAGGARLRAALFTPQFKAGPKAGPVRGSIVLSGGRTEPIEKYYEFIGELLDRGFVVLAHDWRGQGLSQRDLADPLKGHVRGYKAYLDDFQALLGAYADRLPKPWTAVAHSMGGCLTLLAMAHGETRFAGAILSAPMLGLRAPFPLLFSQMLTRLNVLVGRGKLYTLGGAGKPFDATFEGNVLTHDPVRHARGWGLVEAEPKLALGAPTWGWVDFALRATAYLARPDVLRNVTVPVVIVSAGEDQLVDNAAQAAAARHLPQGKFIAVPGASHEILMETDPMRNIFLRALDALLGRTAPTPAAPPAPAPTPAPTAAAAPVAAKPSAPATAPASVAAKPAAKKPAARKPAAKKSAKAPAKAAAAKAAPAKTAAVKPAAKPATAKKPAAPKAAAKAPAVKKPAAKPAAKKAPAKAAAVKKAPAAKAPAKTPAKAVAKKPAAKPAAAAKPVAARKAAPAKKPAAPKNPAAKKPAAKKPAAKTPAPTKA